MKQLVKVFLLLKSAVSVLCVTKAAERQHQSDDYNYQEWYRFVVWEDDKNTRFSLQHYEVLVSKSFLLENSSQKIITKRGGN